MLLPHHHVVVLKLFEGGVGELVGAGQGVGDDAEAEGAEGFCLGYHAPEDACEDVLGEELAVVAHGDELDGMGVYGGFVVAAALDEVGVHGEVAGELAGGHDGVVGDDDVGGAVVEDAYDGAVVHGPSCEVAHALAGAFAIEVAAFQGWECDADGLDVADGWQLAYLVVYEVGDVDGDVAAVALCPAVLPEVSGHFCYFLYFLFQGGSAFEYTFHCLDSFFIVCFDGLFVFAVCILAQS